MPKLPVLSGDELVRALEKLGYSIERIRCGHSSRAVICRSVVKVVHP